MAEVKVRRKKGVAAQYLNYTIDSVYTNEVGNRIYFRDTTKGETLPAFYFDFKEKNIFLEGETSPVSIYLIRRITNGYKELVNIARTSQAPFWVVAYLEMITSGFYSRNMYLFYNCFAYAHRKWGGELDHYGPHDSVLGRMASAERLAKAGLRLNLRYTENELDMETVYKSIPLMRAKGHITNDAYKPVSDTNPWSNSVKSVGDWISWHGIVSNNEYTLYLDVARGINIDYFNYLNTLGNYYIKDAINKIKTLKDLGYDLKRLAQYLSRDVGWQGMNICSTEPLNILGDYARMSFEVLGNKKFTKYPTYLKTFHDIAQKNHTAMRVNIEANKFKRVTEEVAQKVKYLTLKGQKYTIVIPETPQDIIREGVNMHHCVGSYAEDMSRQKTTILFMREKEHLEDALVTLEVKNVFQPDNSMYIAQAKGFANRNLNEEEKEFLDSWAKKNKISFEN